MVEQVVTGLGVHLKVKDIAASRRFYEGILSLKPVFAYGDEGFLASVPAGVPTAPEIYSGVTYEIGDAKLEIADGHIAVKETAVFEEKFGSPKVSAMLNVTTLVGLLQDVQLVRPDRVTHYYWGTLELVVRDPDGWVVVLIAPFSSAERERIAQLVDVVEVQPQTAE